MRQGSSCLSWEPARCSTYSRSLSGCDLSDTKDNSFNTSTPSKQQCPNRPVARQWASRAENSANLDSKLSSTSAQPPSKLNPTKSSSNSTSDNLKALPSRPKVASGPYQTKQVHHSVEENRLQHATDPETAATKRNGLPFSRPNASVEVNVARSRCHPRRRPCVDDLPVATPKLRRDTDCTEAIVRLIVFFSTKLVHTIWQQASLTPKTSKDFNGAGVLPLQVFIQETLRRSKTSYSTLQVALFYLILLRPHVRPCQATQQQYTPGCRALQCGRRMFLTALILASKYLQDRNYSARAWSKISGLPVAEINENERHYLELIKYNLHMSKEAFENWSKIVLTICKASGQGPYGNRPGSPPSSPDGLACSAEYERSGSSGWWLHHLTRLAPEMVKDPKATEEYIVGLATSTPFIDSSLSLDTPPSSPESLEDILSEHSSPLVLPSSSMAKANTGTANVDFGSSPAPVGSVPSRPLPPNLPTPQTTPRYDSAFTFSRKSSQTDLRCRASHQAMVNTDRQAMHVANLETCPPPQPRQSGAPTSAPHPLRDSIEQPSAAWMSSPESSYSDSSSSTTRSRSSSISSVSSVWSVPSNGMRPNDKKPCLPRMESMPSKLPSQPIHRTNIGGYSFYHPVGNFQSTSESARTAGKAAAMHDKSFSEGSTMSGSESCKSLSRCGDLSDDQIAQLLASLSSQSEGQTHLRIDPAVVKKQLEPTSVPANIGPSKKHKRSRSSKEESLLQEEVRQFIWNEQVDVYVKDDKKPTTYVETSDKQAQYPLQTWAHAKRPVPNTLHNKRIALQHSSSPKQQNASELASDFLRQDVAVM